MRPIPYTPAAPPPFDLADPLGRLVAADWLDERDRPHEARLLRAGPLSGSPKQVAWAEKIRSESLDPTGYPHLIYAGPGESAEAARRAMAAAVPLIPAEYTGRAGWWIENRRELGPRLFNAYAFRLWGSAGNLVWNEVIGPRLARQVAAQVRPADDEDRPADPGGTLSPAETADLLKYSGGEAAAERIAAAYGWRLAR